MSGAVPLTLLGREVWQHRGRLADGPAPPGLRALLLGAALAAVLLAISIVPLFPSTVFDSTSYHLPLARNLVQHHGLSYDPFVRYSFLPAG